MATDKLFHKLANSYPATILKLLNIPDHEDFRASSFTFKEIENRRDIIFERQNGNEVILLETQGYDDGYFFHTTIIGAMLYCVQKKFGGQLRIVAMFLEQSSYLAASKLAHHFDGSSGLVFQPIVFIFKEKYVAELEAVNDIRLIPLYPLCNVSPDQIKDSAFAWASRIKGASELTEGTREDLLALLGGFISHRIKNLTVAEIKQMFGGFKMEDTAIGKELIALGHRAGHTEGLIEGQTEGHAKGLEEGENLGSLKTLRESVVDLITTRWCSPGKYLLARLEKTDDIMLLKGLFRALLKAKTRKQMENALGTALNNEK